MKLSSVLKVLFKKQKGQGLVEYSFIIIFIALAVFVALGFLGTSLINFFNYFMTLF
jgi:pilus assembly protein Flp/PilA